MGKEKSRDRERGKDKGKEKKDRKRSRSPKKDDSSRKERRTEERKKETSKDDKKRPSLKDKEKDDKKKKKGGWDVIPDFTPEQIQSALMGVMPASPLALTGSPLPDRQARRLYIGNPPATTTEADLRRFFQEQLANAEVQRQKFAVELQGGDSSRISAQTIPVPQVLDIQLNRGDDGSKPYAFIELNTVEAATQALALDGARFMDHTLKVRRPRDYVGDAVPSAVMPGVVGTQVPDGPNKIFMGGLPLQMSEDQVKELLQSFGTLKNFNMIRDPTTGLSRGYCFFDFIDPSVTDKVIASLNSMKLGERSLIVQRSNPNALMAPAATPASTALVLASPTTPGAGALVVGGTQAVSVFIPGQGHVPVPPVDPEKNFLSALLNLSTPLSVAIGAMGQLPICKELGKAAPVLTSGTVVVKTTRTLVLCNILTEEELEDDEEYDDIEQEIETEVEKYGRVLRLIIPRRYPAPPVIPPHCCGIPPQPRLTIEGGERRLQIMAPGAFGAQRPAVTAPPQPFTVMGPRGPVLVYRGLPANDETGSRQRQEEEEYLAQRKEWEQLMKDPLKSGVGMVFVQYITVDEAHKAQVGMAGKRFNGRTVITSFLPDDYMDRINAEEVREERELELRIEAADKVLAIMEKKELEELEQRTKEEVARAVAAAATAPAPPPPDGLPPDLMSFLGQNPFVPSGMSLGLGLQGASPGPQAGGFAGAIAAPDEPPPPPPMLAPVEKPTGMTAMEADLD